MASWVFVFSKFTPEALLFEALAIFIICTGYSAYWILRKRKVGVMDSILPQTMVKDYLNTLIVDAEQIRAQLFGLLAGAGMPAPDAQRLMANFTSPLSAGPAVGAPSAVAGDPASSHQLSELEAKMRDQAKAMETVILEKTKIEKDLADLKANGAKAGAAPGVDGAELKTLKDKIALLEGKLAEYSVIEDDLANLKRLQQENAQLKAQLGGAAAAPTPPPVAAAAAPEPVAPPPAAAPVQAETPREPALLDNVPTTSPAFEGLVDQVEQSLQPAAPEPAPAVAAAAPAPAAAAPAAPAGEKSDADLVAEFEKMLNG